jgi:hypothetical protein
LVQLAQLEQQGQLALPEWEYQVPLEQRAFRGYKEPQVQLDFKAFRDLLALKAYKALQAYREIKALPELPDCKD